jgi:hypothetical protein
MMIKMTMLMIDGDDQDDEDNDEDDAWITVSRTFTSALMQLY